VHRHRASGKVATAVGQDFFEVLDCHREPTVASPEFGLVEEHDWIARGDASRVFVAISGFRIEIVCLADAASCQ
jgi:hypothetical protein